MAVQGTTYEKLDTSSVPPLPSSSTDDKKKMINANMYAGLASAIGGIAGIVYNMKTKGGFWRGAGFFILGSLAVGVPARIIIYSNLSKSTIK